LHQGKKGKTYIRRIDEKSKDVISRCPFAKLRINISGAA